MPILPQGIEPREELRELAPAPQWRSQLARSRNGRQYSDEQIARALELVADGRSHQAGGAV